MFDWSGEIGDKSAKRSGNFDILSEWQSCNSAGADMIKEG